MMLEEKIFDKQYEKIEKLLKTAQNSTYYCHLFDQAGIDFSKKLDYETFRSIPFLDKNIYNIQKYNMIVNRPADFNVQYLEDIESGYLRNQYLDQFNMRYMITSGSTGQPLEVLKSYRGLDKDYVTLNFYRKRMTTYDFKGQFIWIWPENPVVRKFFNNNEFNNLEFRRENAYGYKYMLYEHSESNFHKIFNFMVENNIEWITTSPSVLYELALYMKENNLLYSGIKYIECHSEKLHKWQAETITDVFQISPVSIYSSNEIQFIGGTCTAGGLHLFNSCFIEFIENSQGIKEIYVTSFNEMTIPIIRYKLGDCGDWSNECNCNHNCNFINSPQFNLKGYRTNDTVVTRNNTQVEPFIITDSIYLLNLKLKMNIREHKVIQRTINRFEYYILTEQRNNVSDNIICNFLKNYLQTILGYEIEVSINDYKNIVVVGSEKYKYFENKVSNTLH